MLAVRSLVDQRLRFRRIADRSRVLVSYRCEYLVVARAVTVVTDCFAAELAGKQVKRVYRFNRIIMCAIASFGNRVIDVTLRGG